MSKKIDAKKMSSPCKKTSRELTMAMYLAARHVTYGRYGLCGGYCTILCAPPGSVKWALHEAVLKLEEELLPGEEWEMIAHEITIALYLSARHMSCSQMSDPGTPPLEVMEALRDAVYRFEEEVLATGVEL